MAVRSPPPPNSPDLGRRFTPGRPHTHNHPRLPPNAIETLVALVTAGELDSEPHLRYNTIGARIEA